MLSRIAVKSLLTKQSPLLVSSRGAKILPTSDANPERDLINFPRPKQLVDPEPVRHGFIPERWFQFLHPKIGVTGPYSFGFGLITYLLSKEIWVTEHDFGYAIGTVIIFTVAHKKFGKQIAAFLDKGVEEDTAALLETRNSTLNNLEKAIESEKFNQERAKAHSVLFDVRRENVALQLEAIYRERVLHAYQQVKNRLEYQAALEDIQRRISQKHMTSWIVNHVLKSITPDQDKSTVKKCIADLKSIAATH